MARGKNLAARRIWAPYAWTGQGWQSNVLLDIDSAGKWSSVTPNSAPPADAERLAGALLPGMVNAHSHAFQRGFAGRSERKQGDRDDFWSWRENMYELALRITPQALSEIATFLYAELLEGGYTHVCEFHYLHRAPDGGVYQDPLAMSRALADAAERSGIGLTLLPVVYERAGFGQSALSDRQRRFRASPTDVISMRDAIRGWAAPNQLAGVAIHSLRAASPESIDQLVSALKDDEGPIHIHIAEQQAEVLDCLSTTGLRPVEWLSQRVKLDSRWHLVHATHTTSGEQDAIAASGAGVVVCPSTEANLGDGRFDLEGFTSRDVLTSIGSDSHVCRQWPHELKLLEYSQRLALQRRNVAASTRYPLFSTGEALFAQTLSSGASAAGLSPQWGLVAGARADAIELDPEACGLIGIPTQALLDATVFACDTAPVSRVWVAGEIRVSEGHHLHRNSFKENFQRALNEVFR
jgi:formimidoylglutamate deiminase